MRDFAIGVDMQAKMGSCSAMASDAMKLLQYFTAIRLRLVSPRLPYSQPAMFYHCRLLSALHTKFQSN